MVHAVFAQNLLQVHGSSCIYFGVVVCPLLVRHGTYGSPYRKRVNISNILTSVSALVFRLKQQLFPP